MISRSSNLELKTTDVGYVTRMNLNGIRLGLSGAPVHPRGQKPYHSILEKATCEKIPMTKGSPDESFWKGKSVLVTGSSGFAGRNLSSLLYLLGSKVRWFVRSK